MRRKGARLCRETLKLFLIAWMIGYSVLWPAAGGFSRSAEAASTPEAYAMADAGQLGLIDLFLTDPLIAALVEAYGGSPAPATGSIALEQERLFGKQRYVQMGRLANAMAAVRTKYRDALARAERGDPSGKGGLTHGDGPGWIRRVTPGKGGGVEYVFDRDAYTDWYLAQDGLQHKAFAAIYGRSSSHILKSPRIADKISTGFENGNWHLRSGDGRFGRLGLYILDPDNPPQLVDYSLVSFDLEAGWVTPYSNIVVEEHDSFETILAAAFVAVVCYVSAGTLGSWAAEAASSAAAGSGASAATATAFGAAASGAVVGASGAVASGIVSGKLSLKSVLQGALAGGLTGGVMNSSFAKAVSAHAGTVGTVALRMTMQGGIQELAGGSFSEGARAAFAAGLGDLAGDYLSDGINQAVESGVMNTSEAGTARIFARLLTSAIRATGNPDAPLYALASDFISETLRAVGQNAVKPFQYCPEHDAQCWEALLDEIEKAYGPDGYVVPVGYSSNSFLGGLGVTEDRLSVFLAGAHPGGGSRSTVDLAVFVRNMSNLTGLPGDWVLDNTNGLLKAYRGSPNLPQTGNVVSLLDYAQLANIKLDMVSHSNSFNSLAHGLSLRPNARLGLVDLIAAAVNNDLGIATSEMRWIVNASEDQLLVTSINDYALCASKAGCPYKTLIPAATEAGVRNIVVVYGKGHEASELYSELSNPYVPPLYIKKGVVADPRVEFLWKKLGWTWNGRTLIWCPNPTECK